MGQVVSLGEMVVQHILPYFIKNLSILALYGYHPPSITSPLKDNTKVQAMEDHIGNQKEVLKLLKDNLVMTQNRMKQQAYQHCSENKFELGG
jgi:hypothetical protein